MTPFRFIAFSSEEAIGCIIEEALGAINEVAIGAIVVPRNLPSFLFIFCFTVSVAPSNNRPDFSSDSTNLIISFICSFEMNKVNSFPALTVPRPLIFLSNLSGANEIALVTNLGKTF